MSNYTKATNFASKDALLTGNPLKIVKGTEIDNEFNAISTAVSTKFDTTSLAAPGPIGATTPAAINGTTGTFTGAVTGTTGTFSGNVQMASANGGQLAGLRNKIINGNMGIFQRGTAAVTVSGNYGPADRWLTSSTGNTFSTTQGSFVSGDMLYDTGGAQFFTTVAVTSVASASNNSVLQQLIEDVRLLAGQTVTVSFWAKAASGTPSIGLEITQQFGTGGSPSAVATGTGQAQALTTTWTNYTKTFSIPSINGKTIGTDANSSSTRCIFWIDAGSNFNTRSGSIGQASKTVSIAQVQLEVGSVATPFEQRPYGMELALCQRYFISYGGVEATERIASGAVTTATNAFVLFSFPVEMRTAPSLSTFVNLAVTTAASSLVACTGVINSSATKTAAIAATASGLVSGNATHLVANSSTAARVQFGAEL